MPLFLPLFLAETPADPKPTPTPAYHTRRAYCRHKQRHVVFLTKHYHVYTLKELAALLGLSERQVFGLCRRHGIRKRAPNKKKAHSPALALAA